MKASCSLWSADLLALKNAIEALSGHADEFHVDVMDGTCVPDILFGLDFVAAMRGITETPLDVHLMTHTSVDLIDRAVASGAAARIRMLTGLRDRLGVKFEIFVDGGIRPDTVPLLGPQAPTALSGDRLYSRRRILSQLELDPLIAAPSTSARVVAKLVERWVMLELRHWSRHGRIP